MLMHFTFGITGPNFRKIVKKAVEELTRARAAQRKRVKDRELKSMISGFQVDPPC